MGSGPGGKNISASRVLPSLKAAPAAARSIPSMSVARSGKAAQAVAAVSAATPVSGSRRHRSRTMGHQVEAGPERIRRHRRRTHAPGRDPVMKTPETPFIGPRPRQSFAPRKVRPCGLLETSVRAGVWPDSVLGARRDALFWAAHQRYRCGSLSVCCPPKHRLDEAWLKKGLPCS